MSPQFGQTGVAFFMAVQGEKQVRKASVFMVVLYGVTMRRPIEANAEDRGLIESEYF
jgi:hypothetical protein